MANRKQQREYAARRHIQTEINRRLTRAAHVAFIMQSNTLHRLNSTISADYCAAVFSYLAEDLLSLQDLIQQQNQLR
ncbi:derepression protein [Escherichia coli]|uniref:derepression protein n=1 Tax=Escherichia coli TaxID=562 RepID=UPI0010B46301|nr:derepression protein [Escherichia coli]ELG6396099.1 derepression protein [Escherichia coli]MCO0987581.1 derepression protein [Escherichia coli]MDF1423094.1 derepression protein [Escherichia coli]MEC9751728.1 derepression protein [Escherichia coli]MED0091279.1 derepression protein [Escherichia coli]